MSKNPTITTVAVSSTTNMASSASSRRPAIPGCELRSVDMELVNRTLAKNKKENPPVPGMSSAPHGPLIYSPSNVPMQCGEKLSNTGFKQADTAQALQKLQQSVGSGNIIVLNIGDSKNLADALSQIVSSNYAKQGTSMEHRAAISTPLNMRNDVSETSSAEPCQTSIYAPLKSVASNKEIQQSHPEQQQPAAFMLVPIPQPQSSPLPNLTVPSNLVTPKQGQTPLSISSSATQQISSEALAASTQSLDLSVSTAKPEKVEAFQRDSSTPTNCRTSAAPEKGQFPISTLCSSNVVTEHATKTAWCANPLSHGAGNHNPAVSSPGLAFLAQVSTLASPEQNKLVTNGAHALLGTSPYISTTSETVLSLDKANQMSGTVIPNALSSSLNSTDNSLDDKDSEEVQLAIETCSSSPAVRELVTGNGFQLIGIAEKRKKEMPHPPVIREKKKKGPAPKLSGNEVCLICGDRASGYHYNTLSCEGCKGFFRRSVIKGAKYQCKQKGDCTMDLYMRRKCQKCRFDKCKNVGMREESVLSEEKVRAKKVKKEGEVATTPTLSLDDTFSPKLSPQQRSLLELLKANERRFQWPTSEDVKKVTVWVEGDDTPHGRALRFAHFTELCILIVQLVVEFTKQLPGFLAVPREDQIVLLKACAIEVLLLRAAKQYNKHDGTINFLNGKLYDKSSFYKAGMQVEFVDPIFKFCNSMAQLDLDETEYAILVAINTFSTDRPHIKDVQKVECMQDPYVELLRVYSKIKHPDDPLMFARILMKIVELRTLNNYHSEQMFALKVQDRKLPPLLAEIWDM